MRKKLALVIPAHNEELAIVALLRSAIAAGQQPDDIFVIDDASTDRTAKLARSVIGRRNVLTANRGGKGAAIQGAVDHFDLTRRYQWIHIADADGVFGDNYFSIFRRNLSARKHVAAIGYVQSLFGDWISRYRVYEYTWGQTVTRRIQAFFGVIPVIPGPTSCFHSDIFSKLNFTTGTLTEDFDVTLQIYRQGLGKIRFIPKAVIYTQDPLTFRDFLVQISRWYRGFFQSLRKHGVATQSSRIDYYLFYISLQAIIYSGFLLALPAIAIVAGDYYLLALFFLADLVIFLGMSYITAAISRRFDMLAAFPFFYITRLAYMAVFLKSFVEIMILNKFRNDSPIWETQGRRYRLNIGRKTV